MIGVPVYGVSLIELQAWFGIPFSSPFHFVLEAGLASDKVKSDPCLYAKLYAMVILNKYVDVDSIPSDCPILEMIWYKLCEQVRDWNDLLISPEVQKLLHDDVLRAIRDCGLTLKCKPYQTVKIDEQGNCELTDEMHEEPEDEEFEIDETIEEEVEEPKSKVKGFGVI